MSKEASTITLNTQTVLIGALVVLVVVALFQTVSLFNLKSTLGGGSSVVAPSAAAPSTSGTATSGSKLKQNLDSLPTMVGGC